VTHRAIVVGAGNAGRAHADALESIGVDVVGPVSGTAAVADPSALKDPKVDVVHVTTANDLHLARGAYLQDWLLLVTDDNWRLDTSKSSASRTAVDIAVHWIDLVEAVTARSVEAVVSQVGYLHGRKTEDHAGLLPARWRSPGPAGSCSAASRVTSLRWRGRAPASPRCSGPPKFCRSCSDTSRVTEN
jgi:predicted dehydrogenase